MTRALLAVGVSGSLFLPAAALAATGTNNCDAYSGKCPDVKGEKKVKPPAVEPDRVSRLPFTGAEIILMTTAAGGAVGAGSALVIAGRRRRRTTQAA
jgi:hypothetical protein